MYLKMKKIRTGAWILIALLLFAIAGVVYFILLGQWHTQAYAAGNSSEVPVYRITEPEDGGQAAAEEAGTVIRGSSVTKYMKTAEVDGVTYTKISAEGLSDEEELYMAEASLVEDAADTVQETEVFVRTPATVYAEAGEPGIASFAPKGTRLEIIGHDRLKENGYINMYKVRFKDSKDNDVEGYVYGKYMAGTQEEADAPYNEHGEYDTAREDGFRFELYGGEAEDLDFYPYERTQIEGNEFCTYARAMYLNSYAAINNEAYIDLIKASGCNAVVIDIKDGPLAYKSPVAKELSPSSYDAAYADLDEMKAAADRFREAGVYMIGRIVTFNDTYYAKDHPEDCIEYGGSSGWPSAYSRNVWEYNVRLAREAVKEFGFNEIQFDYVRFPESTYEMSKSGKADFRNKYKESKSQAVQNFCFYAADQLREEGAYISVDVFGESAYSYVTAYGQYWTAISNIVDAISAMPYTDHFSGDAPWEDPYSSVKRWAKKAGEQQERLQDPAVARTWITGYNTPHWAPTVNYGEKQMKDQIKALEDCGLTGGFIPWNALSDIGKYRQYQAIWNE